MSETRKQALAVVGFIALMYGVAIGWPVLVGLLNL